MGKPEYTVDIGKQGDPLEGGTLEDPDPLEASTLEMLLY